MNKKLLEKDKKEKNKTGGVGGAGVCEFASTSSVNCF